MSSAPHTADHKVPTVVRRRLEKLETDVVALRELVFALLSGKPVKGAGGTVQLVLGDKIQISPENFHERPSGRGKKPLATQKLRTGGGLEGAHARGEAAKVGWVRDGDVVPAVELAANWGISPQALGAAAGRGEAFSVKVGGKLYYPCEFLGLERENVAAVCQALGSLTPSEKLIFWKRVHGTLGGKTVLAALTTGVPLNRIVRLGQAWAAERGAAGGVATA